MAKQSGENGQRQRKRKKRTKAQIKAFLKRKGHRARDVDREIDGKDERDALLALHGVGPDEWRAAVAGGE